MFLFQDYYTKVAREGLFSSVYDFHDNNDILKDTETYSTVSFLQ